MNAHLEHAGYRGSIIVSLEDELLHGKVLDIRSLITYCGVNVSELTQSFKDAVNEYINDCKKDGIAPERPCNGTFNVRVGPETHRKAVALARLEGVTLNELVKRALDSRIGLSSIDRGLTIVAGYTRSLTNINPSLVTERRNLVVAPVSADPYERKPIGCDTRH